MIQFGSKIKLFWCFLVSINLLIGCNQKKIKYIYFANGKVKEQIEMKNGIADGMRISHYKDSSYMISYWKNGLQDGISKSYFPNRKLQGVFRYSNGKLNGNYVIYFENGNVSQIGSYRDGFKVGYQHQYFKNEKSRLWRKVQFINCRGKEMIPSYIEYNKQGKIVDESSRVEISIEKDTIETEQGIILQLSLIKPTFQSMRVLIGSYDEQFYLKDSLRLDTIIGRNHIAKVFFSTKNIGTQYVRGIVEDYKILQQKGDTIKTMAQHIYFEQKLFVKKKLSENSLGL